MKLTESMLRDYVTTPLSAEEIGDLLTMTGFELEGIETVKGEKVLDVNIMANRGDGASVIGLAREVLAKDASAVKTDLYERAEIRFYAADERDGACGELAAVEIETENCGRYACRVFEDVKNGRSPDWLCDRLEKIGQRPISLLVDLTNYVMFETGQPLHAFDLDKLSGSKIVVRQARDDEKKFVTLDEEERAITPDDVLICDAEKPVAVAGVMGGLDSEVSAATKRMLLESANFSHISVRNTRTRIGLSTEASYRFERYVDPDQVVAALNRFAELYEQATGEFPVRGIVDVYPAPVSRSPILLRPSRIAKILGMPVEVGAASQYLTALGFEVSQKDDGLVCAPPTWRIDVVREDDLVEEVGRIHGYEKIPELLPQGETTRGGVFGADAMIDEVRDELLRCGLTQTVSHTLRDLHPLDALGDRTRVRTPHSPEIAHLRNSNLPSLADAANRNGNNDLHLFEIGKVFPETGERASAAILEVGGDRFEDWQKRQSPGSDFFSLKGILERVFARVSAPFGVGASEDERLHPTRQASLESRSAFIGVVGQIHPEKAEACGLPKETVLAEIDLGALWDACGAERHLREISRNPATRRDIAIVLDRSVPYSDVSAAIESAGGEVLERHWLFDVYCGKGIPDGSHSLAIALQLRKVGSNFTDEEANQVRDSVVQALEGLGATLR